jgi:hypothetical protein
MKKSITTSLPQCSKRFEGDLIEKISQFKKLNEPQRGRDVQWISRKGID